jgi:hypothetical protein
MKERLEMQIEVMNAELLNSRCAEEEMTLKTNKVKGISEKIRGYKE